MKLPHAMLRLALACTAIACAGNSDAGPGAGAGGAGSTAGVTAGAGASGSGAAGTLAGAGSGTAGAAGTQSVAGTNAADGGAGTDGGDCPTFDGAFIDTLRDCDLDTDCEVTRYQRDCCGTYIVVGVHAEQVTRLHECAPQPSGFPACGCASQPTLADDGRISEQFDLSDVGARCNAGRCEARVTERQCGPALVCGNGALCVVFETLVGPSSSLAYACADNPCTGNLGCDCAAPLCATRTDTTRACTIGYPPDVYCVDLSQ